MRVSSDRCCRRSPMRSTATAVQRRPRLGTNAGGSTSPTSSTGWSRSTGSSMLNRVRSSVLRSSVPSIHRPTATVALRPSDEPDALVRVCEASAPALASGPVARIGRASRVSPMSRCSSDAPGRSWYGEYGLKRRVRVVSRPRPCAGSRATPASPESSRMDPRNRSTSAARPERWHRRCGVHSSCATAAALLPGAIARRDGATRTIAATGPTAARLRSTTSNFVAGDTIAPCTKARRPSPPSCRPGALLVDELGHELERFGLLRAEDHRRDAGLAPRARAGRRCVPSGRAAQTSSTISNGTAAAASCFLPSR